MHKNNNVDVNTGCQSWGKGKDRRGRIEGGAENAGN